MRLPAITAQQREHEDSRQRHEGWYQAFLDGERVTYQTTRDGCEKDRLRLSGNTRAFWRQRGFIVRTETSRDKRALTIWLESMGQKEQAA